MYVYLMYCFVVSIMSTVLVWRFVISNVELSEGEFSCHSDEEEYVVEINK